MWKDPVVEELHLQRQRHSDKFRQDLAAMVDDTRKRSLELAPAPRVKRAARPPKRLSDAA